jgi:hypothetical protein
VPYLHLAIGGDHSVQDVLDGAVGGLLLLQHARLLLLTISSTSSCCCCCCLVRQFHDMSASTHFTLPRPHKLQRCMYGTIVRVYVRQNSEGVCWQGHNST